MKRLLIILMMASTFIAMGQESDFKPVEEAEKNAFLKQMQQQSGILNCSFVEEKWITVLDETMVSKGNIKYEPGKQLICEYTEPESLVLCKKANGNLSVTRKGKSVVPSPMYKQMMSMMEGFVSGGAMAQKKDYELTMLANDVQYLMRLTPKTHSRFSNIELYVDKKAKSVTKTVLIESKGDRTTITMTPQQSTK